MQKFKSSTSRRVLAVQIEQAGTLASRPDHPQAWFRASPEQAVRGTLRATAEVSHLTSKWTDILRSTR